MRDYAGLARKAYNRMASHYDTSAEGRFTSPFQAELVEEVRLTRGERVLDVACGTGSLLGQLVDRYGAEAHGLDIAENMVAVAKANHPAISFQVGDCTALPFADGFFSTITVCAAFHHFPEPQKFVAEAARALSPGGKVRIAEVYAPPVLRQILSFFIAHGPSGDVRFYAPQEIMAMLARAGLSDCRVKRNGHIQIVSATKR